jgi:hypothetical protein
MSVTGRLAAICDDRCVQELSPSMTEHDYRVTVEMQYIYFVGP